MSREDEWLDAIDLTRKQEAEIAALKAERDRLTIIADAIQAERDRLQRSRDGWEADALREAKNAEYWREREAKLRAVLESIARTSDPYGLARRALDGK